MVPSKMETWDDPLLTAQCTSLYRHVHLLGNPTVCSAAASSFPLDLPNVKLRLPASLRGVPLQRHDPFPPPFKSLQGSLYHEYFSELALLADKGNTVTHAVSEMQAQWNHLVASFRSMWPGRE